jgi:DNA modification methylase
MGQSRKAPIVYLRGNTKLTVGDGLRLTRSLIAGGTLVDLYFADIPFNIGHEYAGYVDRRPDASFRCWVDEMAADSVRVTRPGGAIFWHLPDHLVAQVAEKLRSVGALLYNWIILHQEFGQYGEGRFINSKCHLLYFVKPPKSQRTWCVQQVLEPSRRMAEYNDPRIKTAKFKGMRPMLDVWYGPYLSRVQGNDAERWNGHPNQLRELYMARIIRCATKPGDLVLDPCVGSGTTMVVADTLARRFVGAEICPQTARSAWRRLTTRGCVRDVAGILHSGLSKTGD